MRNLSNPDGRGKSFSRQAGAAISVCLFIFGITGWNEAVYAGVVHPPKIGCSLAAAKLAIRDPCVDVQYMTRNRCVVTSRIVGIPDESSFKLFIVRYDGCDLDAIIRSAYSEPLRNDNAVSMQIGKERFVDGAGIREIDRASHNPAITGSRIDDCELCDEGAFVDRRPSIRRQESDGMNHNLRPMGGKEFLSGEFDLFGSGVGGSGGGFQLASHSTGLMTIDGSHSAHKAGLLTEDYSLDNEGDKCRNAYCVVAIVGIVALGSLAILGIYEVVARLPERHRRRKNARSL
jgi:hypothetical protein